MEIYFDDYLIRSWEGTDGDSLWEYANNRKIWLNLRDIFPHPYSLEDARKWIDFALSQEPECNFVISTPGEAIGGIGLIFGEGIHCQTAELGYWLGEPFWGKGIMSTAVSIFTDYTWANYQVQRIFATPFATNLASRKVLEKAGFIFEGTMRRSVLKDGRILDQALYAVIREQD